MGSLPNFLIIGAAKCGTTALYRYLDQHPDVFLSPSKEPQFYAFEGEQLSFQGPGVTINETAVTRLEDYEALFEGVRNERAIGEASALYLYVPSAAERIQRHVPNARLIAVLRNPTDRAYSSYMHLRREGRESCETFPEALEAEAGRIAENWGFLWRYRDLGLYAGQLRRYYERFPRAQIRVVLYDDFQSRPQETLREIFGFLEVDPDFSPDTSVRHNVSGIPRSRALYSILWGKNRLGQLVESAIPGRILADVRGRVAGHLLRREPFDPALRARIAASFRDEVVELQDLIGRDLSAWLEAPAAEPGANP
ncbi:MAG: sulfotransferase [Myxococcales bacterium]|nr:sulfotransferase [Myxococcales bacterium]